MSKIKHLTWNFVTEANKWAIYKDGYELCKRLNRNNIKTLISRRARIKVNNVIHYGSLNMFKSCFLQKLIIISKIYKFFFKNYYIVSFFHGNLDTNDKFNKKIKFFISRIELIDYIAIPNQIMLKRLLDWGIDKKKIIIIKVGFDSKIFITTGVYNLSLRVGTLEQWGEPAYLEVNVTECLPYSSNAPAYPFNNLQTVLFPGLTGYSSELNPFFADHACCGADYEFLGVGTTCFDYSEYGPVNKLTDQQLNKLDLLGPYNRQLVSIGVDQENDIYSRTFEKKCSEDRGNICSGQGEDVFTLTSCGDDNLGVDDQTERCQGPDNTNIRNTPLNCIDYGSGESFETFFSLGGDGICNEVFRQSNPDDVYDSTGPYSCQAECGSGSCSSPVNCECDNNNECDGLTYEELLLGDISLNECIVGNTFTSCNTGCEYVSDNVCVRDFSKDCFAHLDCDGITQGSAINSYEYCDSNCQLRDCGNYAVNQGLNPAECYTSCWNNNDAKCAPGYHCVVAICVEDSP